jgi:4-methylaminobutanoate oxidase (formaldehyde-forming)
MARICGFEVYPISGREAADMWPLLDPSGVVGAAFLPADGIANPTDVTQALAAAARLGGARVIEHVAVTEVLTAGGRVAGVATERGDIRSEVVVNCTGMWARGLGIRSGVAIRSTRPSTSTS